MNKARDSSTHQIAQEAADWFVRMREEELSAVDGKRFAQWLAESPVHVREYLGVSGTWGALQSAQLWPGQTREELLKTLREAHADNIVPLDAERSFAAAPARRAHSRRVLIGVVFAAGLAALAIAAGWNLIGGNGDAYSTGRGEQRSVVLTDGSVVQLNTMTRIAVHFGEGRRRIELTSGEAFFRVARDASRPFEVETPYALVRAVGTQFNVYNGVTGTRVAVVEGKVQIALRAEALGGIAAPIKTVALGATQFVDIEAAAVAKVAPVARPLAAPQSAMAWMQRRIVFEDDRLDAAVEEFNRYNRTALQVVDPGLAALRISGVFSADDPEALVKYLERVQGVSVHRERARILLRRAQ
jgi:transmembrane sensor